MSGKTPPLFHVIQQDTSIPDDLTFRHGLYCLYALQQWECLQHPASGPYASGYFYKNIEGILHGLEAISRSTALKHHHSSTCIACEDPVDLTRTRLDHIMPMAKGGPEDLSNALVLCRRCNSSKGTKDLLDWWVWKGYDPITLDRRVLCLYTRIHWQQASPEWLTALCTPGQRDYITVRAKHLPTPGHQIALVGSMYAGCALFAWMRKSAAEQEVGV